MKRDMDLIRKILIAVEKHPHGFAPEEIEIDGYDHETVGYHLVLMGQGEGDLLQITPFSSFGDSGPSAIVERMTWKGHEFLDNVRNETVWNKVKGIVIAKGGSISFEVLKSVVTDTAKAYFSQP
jgi:hypothetical protein